MLSSKDMAGFAVKAWPWLYRMARLLPYRTGVSFYLPHRLFISAPFY